ncbi:hypothetical protein AQI88_30490 [Streptomyces cellostaticus]|uniref:Uncharacterized protein n=1 Tax=Streptomyces cellostaticus TaxID=67285 RepID=A0A101NGD3_9ACTN|nr:hypothetical protein [Streptomyces cellostaticus]KUM92711.1 hypothetical protein AQI88_30490 [Streptomyces cellostaticus]GHI06685.1 hypothetical protein Scel_50060 [Streptomyces cellostaticus]
MRARTAGFIESLLLLLIRALLPARGRHRAVPARLPYPARPLTTRTGRPPALDAHLIDIAYDTRLVRPYLLTPEVAA